jgi:serine phosphatase RsbU (regulator of sigma subunit)
MRLNPYALSTFASALMAGATAVYTWRRRPAVGATSLAVLILEVTWWLLTYSLELASVSKSAMVFWLKIEYLGIAFVPAWLLIFVLQYTGRGKWLTRRNVAVLFVIPLITLLLNWTNEWHGLYYRQIEVDTSHGIAVLALTKGVWYWVHTAYLYVSLSVAAFLFMRMYWRRAHMYRGQAEAIFVALLIPWIGSIVYLSGFSPFPNLDLSPFTFAVMCLAITWGLFRFRLLDIVPVARDVLFEGMADGVMVLDMHNRIVDINSAGRSLIGQAAVIGQKAEVALAAWFDLAERLRDVSEVQTEIALEGATPRYLDLHISPLHDYRGHLLGRLVVLRDITARRLAELTAQAVLQREMELAHRIQMSLLPRTMPHIPGIDIIGVSVPAREVGGDLYDCYELPQNIRNPRGGYAIAVGDVTGKGTPAAMYMAVSTAILAARAPFVPDVAQLVDEINAMLYHYMSPNRMYTALCYVRLEPVHGQEAAPRYTAHIVNAGLVAPILRRGAQCEYLDVRGSPLGLLASTSHEVLELPLHQGDILALSSDGIAEAMSISGEMYGLDRLAACVAAAPYDSAQEIQEWVLWDVHKFIGDAELRDDLTLVVMVVR